MATDFVLPDLGEDIDEADVTKVYVSEGDTVVVEQSILEIETEKATLDVPASIAGTVLNVLVAVGDTIHPGQPILSLGGGAASPEPRASTAPATDASPSQPTAPPPAAAAEPAGQPPADPEVEPSPSDDAPTPAPIAAPPTGLSDDGAAPVFAAPSTRKFAREIGVDIRHVEGSGPGGRIAEADVKRHARDNRASSGGTARPAPDLPDFARYGPIERQKLSRFRRTVARNMGNSWDRIPRVSLQHMADVTELEEFRQLQKKRAAEAGAGLTMTAILVKIAAAALRAHPQINASLDIEAAEIILKDYVHIGVAVDTERGLVVPVIRDVDQKNIVEIGVELSDLSQRARDNKLTLDEMHGASFTVTNLGGLGTGFFSPVINWPEVAILAVGRAERVPIYEGDEVVPRLRLPLTLAFDHRAFDGADGARFMSWMVDAINQPLMLALEG